MDTTTPRGRSWLAALLMVLLVACGVALVGAFWKTIQPQPESPNTLTEEELPRLADEEALRVLTDPEASSLERTAASDVVASQGAKALPQLLTLLDHPSLDVRISAVVLLGRLGPDAAEVAPRLQALCTDSEPLLREVAVPAVMRVHRNPQALRDTLREALDLGPEPVSLKAVHALAHLDPPPLEDLERVATTAENPVLKDSAVRYLAPYVLKDRELLRRLLKHGVRFPEVPNCLDT